MANPDDVDTSDSRLALAKSLVRMVWGAGKIPAIFDVEYEGANWSTRSWTRRTSNPYAFSMRGGAPFAFAGLCDAWKDPGPGSMATESFTIITAH
jgi:hypothetical protein